MNGSLSSQSFLNRVVDDLPEITNILLRAVVIALADCLEIMLKVGNEGVLDPVQENILELVLVKEKVADVVKGCLVAGVGRG